MDYTTDQCYIEFSCHEDKYMLWILSKENVPAYFCRKLYFSVRHRS